MKQLNFQRLCKVLQMELGLHWWFYIKMAIIVIAIFIFKFGNIYFFNGNPLVVNYFLSISSIFVIIAPFMMYDFVYDSTKGITYTLLPATALEKILSVLVHCVISVPIIVFGSSLLMMWIGDLVGFPVLWDNLSWNWFFNEEFLGVLSAQAFVILGVFWFKNQKVLKTVLAWVVILFVFILLTLVIAFSLRDIYGWGEGTSINFDVEGLKVNGVLVLRESVMWHWAYLKYVFVLVLPWTVAYHKFRRTQI